MMHSLRYALTATALVMALVACVPRNAPTTITSVPNGTHWYPHEVGTFWTYVPEGEDAGDAPYRYFVRGPSVFRGVNVTLYRLSGRGNEINYHRSITDDGVRLHHEERVGVTLTYDPPIKELPALHDMTPGFTWKDTTNVTVNAAGEQATYPLTYTFTIETIELTTTPIGTINAFRITQNLQIDPTNETDPIIRTIHYAPHVGYLTNNLGLILTNTNAHTLPAGTNP